MDRRAWQATVCGVRKSQTQLSESLSVCVPGGSMLKNLPDSVGNSSSNSILRREPQINTCVVTEGQK